MQLVQSCSVIKRHWDFIATVSTLWKSKHVAHIKLIFLSYRIWCLDTSRPTYCNQCLFICAYATMIITLPVYKNTSLYCMFMQILLLCAILWLLVIPIVDKKICTSFKGTVLAFLSLILLVYDCTSKKIYVHNCVPYEVMKLRVFLFIIYVVGCGRSKQTFNNFSNISNVYKIEVNEIFEKLQWTYHTEVIILDVWYRIFF